MMDNIIACHYIDSCMLTSEQCKFRLRALIVLIIIALVMVVGAAAVIIISEYYGFSISTPFTCATTETYFIAKYSNHNVYLSASFLCTIFSVLASIVLLIIIIPPLVEIDKLEKEEADKQTQSILERKIQIAYAVISCGVLGVLIPLGYFASIVIEYSNKCNASISIRWLIIVAAAALAQIIFIVALIIVIRMNFQLQGDAIEEIKNQSIKNKSEKDLAKKIENMEGEIINQSNDQNIPLLQKENAEQPQDLNVPIITVQLPPSIMLQTQPIKSIPKTNSQKVNPSTPTFTLKNSKSQQPRFFGQQSATQHQPITQKPTNYPYHQPQKDSKIQIKPDGQNVTHITFNFPSNIPGMQPLVNAPTQLAGSSSNDPKKAMSRSKSQRREIIKQTREQELSSDSDDQYYKRARKSKKRKLNYKEDEIIRNSKKRMNVDVDYDRQFERIPSRFHQTPQEPRYVVLSPESIRTLVDFVKNQQESPHQNRNFPKPQPNQNSHQKLEQVNKKIQSQNERKNKAKKIEGNNQLRVQNYVSSQVKEYNGESPLANASSKKEEGKQRSIYEKLEGNGMDDGLKKYENFFKSSRQLNQKQTPSDKASEYDDYFNLLNSNSRVKDQLSAQENYRSISGYSSVLNDKKGKMPIQRQQSSHKKINLDENRIRHIKEKKGTQNIMTHIRNKYN